MSAITTPEIEENNIQEMIGEFYLFIEAIRDMRETIDHLPKTAAAFKDNLHGRLDDLEVKYRDSQEWIISRYVQEIRMGVVGTPESCKSTLICAFVGGVVEMGEDEPNGRYKIKQKIGTKPCLLLIREESNNISRSLTHWADILILVFSYSDQNSLNNLVHLYAQYFQYRGEAPEAIVLLVGVLDDPMTKKVSEGDVRKVASIIDNATVVNTTLAIPTSVHQVFHDACRQYLLSLPQYSTEPPLPGPFTSTYSPGSQGSVLNTIKKFENAGGSSPIIKKRKSTLFKPDRGPHSMQKQGMAVGTGRVIPIKEGPIYKKSAGMRSDWKKKYLVLTEYELTYYPNITDYMNQVHGKTLPLQHITVKVPGQHMPIAKSTSLPQHANLTTEPLPSIASQSDRSESMSPACRMDERVHPNCEMEVTVTPSSPPRHDRGGRERSPISETDSTETLEGDLSRSDKYPFSHQHMSSHVRNNSMDEMTLQMLKTKGATFPLDPGPEERERASTMTRLQRRPKKMKPTHLTPISHSEEDLSDRSASQENLKPEKKGKKGDKDRNSLVLVERTASDSYPSREDKKDKKANNKHRRNRSVGVVKMLDTDGDVTSETAEFHIHSLDGKVWLIEAPTVEEMNEWVKAIELQIKKLLEDLSLPKRHGTIEEAKSLILACSGNDLCADCGSPNPEWASLNHGCVVCIACSGVHRNLGSHISRIRSLHLDEWKPEVVMVMTSIGNEESWKIFEAKLPRNKPNHSSSVEEREKYVRAKYIDKEFLSDLPSNAPVSIQLLQAVEDNDPIQCVLMLAHCRTEDINHQFNDRGGMSCLHIACNLGRVVIVQLLVWKLADVDLLDYSRKSPLFYARIAGHEDCAQILIQNNCNEDISIHSPVSSESGSNEVISGTTT